MSRAAVVFLPLLLSSGVGAEPVIQIADPRPPPSPKGFLEMFVAGVVPSPDGHTLVLVNAEEQVLLPLGIGLSEALSIHGRLEKRQLSRPMTHDLLDNIVAELGGSVVRVQIDDLKDDVFTGTVFIRVPDRKGAAKVVSFDARPSDAVALAIGAHAPIYVARPVVDKAAIHPGDLEDDDDDAPAPSASVSPQPSILSL